MIRALTIQQVEHLAHELARKIMGWNEPIPDFSTRFPNRLESCLAAPFQTFARRDLYSGLNDKAAILFYFLIKNHPFQNGNKRIAVTSLIAFLWINGYWLEVAPDELYRVAVWVAESPPIAKEGVIVAMKDFLKKWAIKKKV